MEQFNHTSRFVAHRRYYLIYGRLLILKSLYSPPSLGQWMMWILQNETESESMQQGSTAPADTLLKMGYSTTMCHYWDMSVK